jgi:hypothetical protein
VDNPAPARGILVDATGELQMAHTTVAGNGTGLEALTASVHVEHSILGGNGTDLSGVPCSAIDFSDVCDTDCTGLGGLDCSGAEGNIWADPAFRDPGGGDYGLPLSSPAVDAGAAPECFSGTPARDLEGRPRLLDADGDGLARPDLGAIEAADPTLVPADVRDLRWQLSGSKLLTWDEDPGVDGYHVYRGEVADLGFDHWGVCLDTVSGSSNASYLDPEDPAVGQGFFYLITGWIGDDEGTKGFATGAERSNYGPCL